MPLASGVCASGAPSLLPLRGVSPPCAGWWVLGLASPSPFFPRSPCFCRPVAGFSCRSLSFSLLPPSPRCFRGALGARGFVRAVPSFVRSRWAALGAPPRSWSFAPARFPGCLVCLPPLLWWSSPCVVPLTSRRPLHAPWPRQVGIFGAALCIELLLFLV